MKHVQNAIIGLAAVAISVAVLTGCNTPRISDRIDQNTESIPAVNSGFDTFGRRWSDTTVTKVEPVVKNVAMVAAPVMAQSPNFSAFELKTGLIHLTKKAPAVASLGEEYAADITATALEDCASVVITDTIPDGATYIKSEPPATREGNTLTWRFPAMRKGETKNIKVFLKADKEGDLAACTTVSALPQGCLSTLVGKPVLTIAKTGPATAILGSDVTYNIVVANKGTTLAKNVVVTDAVPDGLSHASGQKELTFALGDLAPNQTTNIPVTFKTTKRGNICNPAVANSSNAGKVNSEACTLVQQPGLRIVKVGEKTLLINRIATYTLLITNTGDITLTGVVVTDNAAAQTAIVDAPGAATLSSNAATWNVGELKAGEQKTFTVKVVSKVPGSFCDNATVASAQGLKDASEACTEWVGVTGVLVEVVDDPDPIQVGDTTTFTVQVMNQGFTRAIEQIDIKAFFPEETDPVSASDGGAVSGKNVTWATIATLGPRKTIKYTITAKGVKAGDSRMRVEVTTQGRQTAITELESTTVY